MVLIKQNALPQLALICDIPVSAGGTMTYTAPDSIARFKNGSGMGGAAGGLGSSGQPSANCPWWAVIGTAAGDTDTLGQLIFVVLDAASNIIGQVECQVVAFDPAADIWGVALPGSYSAGKAGYILGHSSSSDPWATVVPGAYVAGEAGYALGNMALATASVVLSSPNAIDVGLSLAQAVKLVTAVLCGVSSVSGFVVTFMDTTDSIARVVATLDGTGQRTGVVYNTA